MIYFFLFLLPIIAFAQPDCFIEPSHIQPIIEQSNPYFYNYSWDSTNKIEIANLSPTQTIRIQQLACTRHHTKILATFNKTTLDNPTITIELFTLLDKIFLFQPDYLTYKKDFQILFKQHFSQWGQKARFNFHLADRTFICECSSDQKNTYIEVEMVRQLYREQIKLPGIKPHLDDGWKQPVK